MITRDWLASRGFRRTHRHPFNSDGTREYGIGYEGMGRTLREAIPVNFFEIFWQADNRQVWIRTGTRWAEIGELTWQRMHALWYGLTGETLSSGDETDIAISLDFLTDNGMPHAADAIRAELEDLRVFRNERLLREEMLSDESITGTQHL